jgi:hypothetical protein
VGNPITIYTSTDGLNWTSSASPGGVQVQLVAYSTTSTYLFGTNLGKLYKSTNGGGTWTISYNGTEMGGVTDIVWDGTNFVIACVSAGSGSVFYSSDGVTLTRTYTPAGAGVSQGRLVTNGGKVWWCPVGTGVPIFVSSDSFATAIATTYTNAAFGSGLRTGSATNGSVFVQAGGNSSSGVSVTKVF